MGRGGRGGPEKIKALPGYSLGLTVASCIIPTNHKGDHIRRLQAGSRPPTYSVHHSGCESSCVPALRHELSATSAVSQSFPIGKDKRDGSLRGIFDESDSVIIKALDLVLKRSSTNF